MSKALIIIPTYNESGNIKNIINQINNTNNGCDILVIDDNSPDQTFSIVEEIIKENPNVKLLKRQEKTGIGSAYCEGFEYAIKKSYQKVIQIDADLSHNPKDINLLLNESHKYDLVIGSRYISGIRIINWPLSRLALSYFANVYARIFTGMTIKDCTGGFKCIDISFLKTIDFQRINSHGYCFQIEVNYLAYKNKCKIKEIPIIFTDRVIGESKISKKIILEAILIVPFLRFKNLFS